MTTRRPVSTKGSKSIWSLFNCGLFEGWKGWVYNLCLSLFQVEQDLSLVLERDVRVREILERAVASDVHCHAYIQSLGCCRRQFCSLWVGGQNVRQRVAEMSHPFRRTSTDTWSLPPTLNGKNDPLVFTIFFCVKNHYSGFFCTKPKNSDLVFHKLRSQNFSKTQLFRNFWSLALPT